VSTGSSGDVLLSLDMSYEIDLWGRVRRTVAAARHEAQATAADLETARLSLQAELAMDYFELRAADAQKQLLDETVKAFEAALQLTTNRFQGGAARGPTSPRPRRSSTPRWRRPPTSRYNGRSSSTRSRR